MRVIGRFCIVLVALVAAHCPVAAWANDDVVPRGFFWEATRGADRVLLVGTIHVGKPQFAAAAAAPALAAAQVIAFEANVFDAQTSLAAAQRYAMYPDGAPGLDAQADAATLARLRKVAAGRAGGLPLCCRMKPWMVANTLVLLEAAAAGLSPAFGAEALLYQAAVAGGKPIVEIEGVEEQMRLFDEAAPAVQLDYLRDALETIESGASRADIERLVVAWERGDEAAMEQLAAEMARSGRDARRFVAERIFVGRHPKMVAAIERYAASGRLHAVAIGSLHYFGPNGLLRLLRDRGFTVRRLS